MKNLRVICLYILAAYSSQLVTVSCTTLDLYEKSVSIPGHSWKSSFRPSFTFTIKDTSVPYKLYFIIRHNDQYNFNNIYINLTTKQPSSDSIQTLRFPLELAKNETGWDATGMDDIYEHRIPLTPTGESFYFKKSGNYTFIIEQIMREDPLKYVLNVGLRIEKKH
ncbi:MAG: gliding motility lipoprotein GldH [Chitinophagaceae bacterium]